MRKRSTKYSVASPAQHNKPTAIPKTEPPIRNAPIRNGEDLKSFVRKILLASPEFPRMYAQLAASQGADPKQARDLAEKYQKNETKKISGGTMSIPNVRNCTHIKVDGVLCGSPAIRGEQFCYFHQRMVRGVRTPRNSRLHPIAMLESPEAIQAALMEVINALARNQIDVKRAELILRALHIAVKNARNVHFGLHSNSMVKHIPEYENAPVGVAAPAEPALSEPRNEGSRMGPGATEQPGRSDPQNDLDLPATAAEPFARPPRELSHREFWKRDAEESKRQAAEIRAAREREAWRASHPRVDPLAPKPPLGVKSTPAPKQKKASGAASA
jgi:hypothetical protein